MCNNEIKDAVSIIIPVYNRSQLLKKCLDSVYRLDWPKGAMEVIVVDDGSQEDIASVVNNYPGIILLWQNKSGDTAARNLGVLSAKGKYIFFTDSDCELDKMVLKKLYKCLLDKNAAAVRGAYFGKHTALVSRFIQKDFDYRQASLKKQKNIDLLDTAFTLIRKDVFIKAGGFDPSINVCGDVELSYKLNALGESMFFVWDAYVYHQHSSSFIEYIRNKYRKGFWRTKVFLKYPKKIINDSYTPLNLKLQIAAIPAAVILFLYFILSRTQMALPFIFIFLLFLLAGSFKFILFTFKNDVKLGIVSPLFIFIRMSAVLKGFIDAFYYHLRN